MDLIATSQKDIKEERRRRSRKEEEEGEIITHSQIFEGALFLFENIEGIQNLSFKDQKYIETKFSEDKSGHHYGNKLHIDRWM